MSDDYWPAVFFNLEADGPVSRSDTIEVPVGTTFLVDFLTITTNLVQSGDEGTAVGVYLQVQDVRVYSYPIEPTTFFGGQTIELPLQGFVVPQQATLNLQIQWGGAGDGFYVGVHIAGRVTARSPFVGIFERGSFPPA